jgi:hypothetical protein
MPRRQKMSESTVNPTEGQEPEAGSTPDELAVLREKLAKANAEAAGYRVRAKEAVAEERARVSAEFAEQISALTDEKTALTGQFNDAQMGLTKLRVALAAGIPGESAADFADLLKGSTEEEITAHAEKVKGLFGKQAPVKTVRPVDPAQGRSGGSNDDAPEAVFARFLNGHLSK